MFTILILEIVAILALYVAIAVALWALIETYYYIKEKVQNSTFYKVYKILRKLSNGEIQTIIVVRNPDGSLQIRTEAKRFSASEMRGTPIEKAFEQAERNPKSRIEGDVSVELQTTKAEEDEIKRKAGR